MILTLLLAAAAMTSTYVAMLGFISIFIHGALRAYRLRNWREGALPIVATILGGLLVLPFYYQLSKLDQYRGPSIQPIIRPCPSEEPIRDAVASTVGASPPVALFLTRVGGLLPQYFFEFGFLFFVLVFWKRTGVGSHNPDGLWNRLGVMIVVALVVGSIFVSVRTWNCDLNWRIMHPVQIALLGAAPAFWRDFRAKPRPIIDKFGVALFLIIGASGTAYDLIRSRGDYLWQWTIGERARSGVEAATWLNAHIPIDARVALDPRTFGGEGNGFVLHLLRAQVVASDDNFNVFPYGPDKKRVETTVSNVTEAFLPETGEGERTHAFERYNVSYVLVNRWSKLIDWPAPWISGLATDAALGENGRWRVLQLRYPNERRP